MTNSTYMSSSLMSLSTFILELVVRVPIIFKFLNYIKYIVFYMTIVLHIYVI